MPVLTQLSCSRLGRCKMDMSCLGCDLCNSAFVSMMEPADLRYRDDIAFVGHLRRPGFRAVHAERQVRSRAVVVFDILSENPPEMILAEDGDVVEAFTANTPIQPLRVGILPRTVRRREHLFYTHVLDALPKPVAIDLVAVAEQVLRRSVPRESLYHLLRCPR